MSHNTFLLQRLFAIQQALIAQHAAGVGLSSAVSGVERETFLREFLQKVFPSHRRFATGQITDAKGRISGQVDIIVEYGFSPSFPMPSTEERLVLAKSVALAIEVKSNLSSQWTQVQRTVKKIKTLQKEIKPIMVLQPAVALDRIPCIAVGYEGYSTVEGLTRRLLSTPEDERPDGVLIIQPGLFAGYGVVATGPMSLYAFVIVIQKIVSQLILSNSNPLAYIDTPDKN